MAFGRKSCYGCFIHGDSIGPGSSGDSLEWNPHPSQVNEKMIINFRVEVSIRGVLLVCRLVAHVRREREESSDYAKNNLKVT